jgi:glycosyltransferase involved in cell wall biosynthesis
MKLPPYPFTLKPLSPRPLVSVIIGNYNYGQYLGDAIESIFQQTYPHIELIVVDDGSTDQSRQVMETYGDRIVALYQTNGGQTAAFNTGIAQAQGEIVCFLDSDDTFHPEKVAKMVTAFQHHPDWVQISHYWSAMDAAGHPLPHRQKSLSQGDVRGMQLQYGKYKSALTSALAYRTEVLKPLVPIPQRRSNADAYLMLATPFYGEVGVISDVLMQHRIHGNNQHAGNVNLEHHLFEREWVVTHLNQMAQRVGISQQYSLRQDPDYLTFKAVAETKVSKPEAFRILWLTLRQSIALQRSYKESTVRLLWGGFCVLSPQSGRQVLATGVTKYLRRKLLGRSSQKPVSA